MLDLQLAFTPRSRRGSILGWSLLFTGLACAACVGLRAQTLLEQREALTWRLAAASAPPAPPAPVSSQAAAEAAQLDTVRMRLQASWNPVFEALERSASGKIAFLSIQVTARTGSLELDAQAQTLQDALNSVATLQRQPILRQVLLQRYKRLNDTPGQPLDVHIHAELMP
ncbi:exported hypothetical protein [Thiomonas sp. CB3]|jgi:hypothetical protein|nr:exported hypothetical protein [Thiomonas sp. CB3]